jgi:hypothetical protein
MCQCNALQIQWLDQWLHARAAAFTAVPLGCTAVQVVLGREFKIVKSGQSLTVSAFYAM